MGENAGQREEANLNRVMIYLVQGEHMEPQLSLKAIISKYLLKIISLLE